MTYLELELRCKVDKFIHACGPLISSNGMHIVRPIVCDHPLGLIEASVPTTSVPCVVGATKHATSVLEIALIVQGMLPDVNRASPIRVHLVNSAEFQAILIDLLSLLLLLHEYLMHLLLGYGRCGPLDLSVHVLHLGHTALAERGRCRAPCLILRGCYDISSLTLRVDAPLVLLSFAPI